MGANVTDTNRPLRILDKVMQGGLGAGNVGVIMGIHGTGKSAIMTTMALDHAMSFRDTLHVAIGKSVRDIRAFHDEVFEEITKSLNLQDKVDLLTVERHKQIYAYRDGAFTLKRLKESLNFLADHADFRPVMIEIQGWPDFRTCPLEDLRGLKQLATEFRAEVWCAAQTAREDQTDPRGVPSYVARAEENFSVIINMVEEGDHLSLQFIKTHAVAPPKGIHLEFDPKSMLLRWR
ncbi:MAG: hypothetical protein ACKVX7_12775 [Planctomycetota bacterium]